MVGVVIVAHGPLPQAIIESVSVILGEMPGIASVALMPGDSLEGLIERIEHAIATLHADGGTLLLLDLFGGSPSNAAAFLAQQRQDIRAVSGVNMPMVLETLTTRMHTDELDAVTQTALAAGAKGIVDIVQAFSAFQRNA